MTNEELLERIANGEEAALTKLCLVNTGLVKDRARLIARQYHCLRQTKYGGLSDYAKETLSELEGVGKLALVECIRTGSYKTEKGRFTTYVTPFLDGAMRRHLECSMGTLSLDRDSMGLVRKMQRLYYQEGKNLARSVCPLESLSVWLPGQLPTPHISSLSMICKTQMMMAMFMSGSPRTAFQALQRML